MQLAQRVRSISRVFGAASLGAGRVVLAVVQAAPCALSTRRWQLQGKVTPDACILAIWIPKFAVGDEMVRQVGKKASLLQTVGAASGVLYAVAGIEIGKNL